MISRNEPCRIAWLKAGIWKLTGIVGEIEKGGCGFLLHFEERECSTCRFWARQGREQNFQVTNAGHI